MEEKKESKVVTDEAEDLFELLDKTRSWEGYIMGNYQGFWFDKDTIIPGVLFFQRHHRAKDTDIIVASLPKSGTTWLKALVFSIVNRSQYSASQSPLLNSNSHELVPFIEFQVCKNAGGGVPNNDPNPRILSTHVPYQLYPSGIHDSGCKIVYVCRNPLDNFISSWHFCEANRFDGHQPLPIAEAFELFYEGIGFNCPFWDHVLGYWNASLNSPEKVLFLKYEDVKKDVTSSVKRIADFLGFSFSPEEEENGAIEEITRLCSFENMKSLEVNMTPKTLKMLDVKKNTFFRKGKVGDWSHYLSPSAVERFQKRVEGKLANSGLSFEFHHR